MLWYARSTNLVAQSYKLNHLCHKILVIVDVKLILKTLSQVFIAKDAMLLVQIPTSPISEIKCTKLIIKYVS